MRLPTLPVQKAARETVEVFKGYNHNLRISDGEFFDMKNMTSDYYPVLSPRRERGIYAKPASPQGMIAKDMLCYVDGADFVVGEERIPMELSTAPEDCPKRLTSMGAYVIIMPDKKYVNTAELDDYGSMEASVSAEDVTFSLCTVGGEEYGDIAASPTEPENPAEGSYWIDTSGEKHVLKRYSAGAWVGIASTYVKISAPGIGAAFREFDGITLSGITAEKVKSLNGSAVIWARGEDYIVIPGIVDQVTQQEEAVTLERRMPAMDFLIESENRLWGCRYGTAANGEQVNEIYASKLGDFRNWNCFMGLSTDSYAASCGTDGPFTGAVTHLGIPLFFKENCVHKVYGNYPANYQIKTTVCRGVQRGSHGSLAIVNETLFYKSANAVCAYDGALPVEVSGALGNETYHDAAAGAHGNKYYISMRDSRWEWHLFVYDTAKGMWHREDEVHAIDFCAYGGELYCTDGGSRNILALQGSGERCEDGVAWMAETGELTLSSPDMKYISRLALRMSVEPGTEVNLYARYDVSGEWVHLCNIRGTALRSFSVPVTPRRCDHMKLRLEGRGAMKLYSITKTIEGGSDRS